MLLSKCANALCTPHGLAKPVAEYQLDSCERLGLYLEFEWLLNQDVRLRRGSRVYVLGLADIKAGTLEGLELVRHMLCYFKCTMKAFGSCLCAHVWHPMSVSEICHA